MPLSLPILASILVQTAQYIVETLWVMVLATVENVVLFNKRHFQSDTKPISKSLPLLGSQQRGMQDVDALLATRSELSLA
jgi:hypothetical protein